MSTETIVAPDAETLNPAPETTEVVEPKPADDGKDPSKVIERMQRRIDKKHAAAASASAENALLKEQLRELQGKQDPPKESKDDVTRQAEVIADAKMFARTAESIVADGKKLDHKFMDQLRDLSTIVGEFVQPNGLPSSFMKTVLEISEAPTKLLHHLAKNPDLAEDLADLSPTKLAARLDRIERGFSDSATSKNSSAPKPLEPVKPSGGGSKDPNDMNYKEFVAWRRRSISERR